ncbi:Retrotransposon gag domain - like 10 [Theobroma cacao]|nr:Retrotransposon gag domain - like 10 [Theobroma cacao]
MNALAKEIQGSAAHVDTASEVWSDLEERFTQGIASRVYELKHAIALFQQDKTLISSYYGNLKAVWGELQSSNPILICTCGCTCGATKKVQIMREEDKVYEFLMGLDDSFSIVRSQLLSIESQPSIGRAYVVAAQKEKQRLVVAARTPIVEATALMAKNIRGGQMRVANQIKEKT